MKTSKTGYKRNSKDKDEPMLKIPSNHITMKGVDFPVYGVDDMGYSQMMYPGMDYLFPGNHVYEIPMAQRGGDPSIPDLSNRGWLSKYQKGGVHQKIYTDLVEFAKANQAYNDSLVLHDNTKNMINDLISLDNIYKNNPNILADKWLDYSNEWYKSKGPKVDLPYNRLTKKNKKAPEPSRTYESKVDPFQMAVEYRKPTEEPVYQPEPEIKPIVSKPGVLPTTGDKGLMPSKKLQVKEGLVPTRETYYANFNPSHPEAGKITHYYDPVKKQIVKNPEYELRKDGGWLSKYQDGGNANFDTPYLTGNTQWKKIPEGNWVMGMQDGGIMKLQNAEKKPIYTAAKGFNDYIINVTLSKSGGSTQGDWLNKYK